MQIAVIIGYFVKYLMLVVVIAVFIFPDRLFFNTVDHWQRHATTKGDGGKKNEEFHALRN
jgi:hypothetical protein